METCRIRGVNDAGVEDLLEIARSEARFCGREYKLLKMDSGNKKATPILASLRNHGCKREELRGWLLNLKSSLPLRKLLVAGGATSERTRSSSAGSTA